MWLSYSTRILFHDGRMMPILLCVVLLTMSAFARPASALDLQYLPTRPNPTSTLRLPQPTSTSPSMPTATPQPPSPTSTPMATSPTTPIPTPTSTATAFPPAPNITPTLTATLETPTIEPVATSESPTPGSTAPLPLPIAQVTTTQQLPEDVILTQSVDLSFKELGYGASKLSEQQGAKWISLYLPRNLVPINDGSYLDLTISHVPPEPDKLSVLGVELNGVSMAVITLSEENTEPTTYRLDFKNATLAPGRNLLYILLDAGAQCNVRGARVDAVVYETSSFHIEYALTRRDPDLAFYPIPFFERSFDYEPVYVVLPDNPSEVDLSAAATLAAGLGKLSYGDVNLVSVLDTQLSTDVRDNYHLIVIGKKGNNRLLDQLELPLSLDDPALSEEQGVIQELVSPWNPLRMILILTGRSDESLLKASQALNWEAHLVGMQGQVAIVQTVLPPELIESHRQDVDFTLADLGYEEDVLYGTRPHTFDYRFYMPLGWAATEEPRFTLYFGHARTIDPLYSSLTVLFNDVPIDSVLLDNSNASEGVLEVVLPAWLIESGHNWVRISVEMNLSDEDKCLFLDARHLWTTIYSHSYFHVPFVPREVEPSLDLFPYPFDKQPNLSGLILVLPDYPRQIHYDLMLKVAAGLGAADGGDFLTLAATKSSLVSQEYRPDRDLILIGRPSIHSLIAELNDHLPQPFEPGRDLFRFRGESVVLAQEPPRHIGLIEELPAPWNAKRMVLVLAGTTDEGIALAVTSLFSRNGQLAGNMAVVEESIGVRSFDTRSLSSTPTTSTPTDQITTPASDQTLLIRLGERWW